jgi:hypothetical protein
MPLFVRQSGPGLRASSRSEPGAVAVAAPERLRALEEVLPGARSLSIHGGSVGPVGPRAAGSAWVADFGDCRFTLVLSAEVWRGFSGEGRALGALAAPPDAALVLLLHRALRWQSTLRAADLARELGEAEETVRRALAALGVRGLVGYDLAERAWFHRELPYDLASLEELQPRFAAAEALLATPGAVLRSADVGDGSRWDVQGTGVVHLVSLDSETPHCTCPWFAKTSGERGACKHVLAAQMARAAAAAADADDGDAP